MPDSPPPGTIPPRMICAVCGYVLEHTSNRDMATIFFNGQEFGHIRPSLKDHVVVPVDPGDVEVNGHCDFCDVPEPTEVVVADTFITGLSRSVGNWAACEECAELVRRRRWSQLVTRVRGMIGHSAATIPRSLLLRYYEDLDAHMHEVITLTEWRARGNS
jgi:hypothetical protein